MDQLIPAKTNVDEVIERLLRRTPKDQLRRLVTAALESEGEPVGSASLEGDDDELCPRFRFHFPIPHRFSDFILQAAELGTVRVFPLGLLAVNEILVETQVGKVA